MSEVETAYIPVDKISIRHRATASIAVIGNPNSGKSTLFNRLTGLRQTTGNYPGVTVEKHSGTVQLNGSALELVDLRIIRENGQIIKREEVVGRLPLQP